MKSIDQAQIDKLGLLRQAGPFAFLDYEEQKRVVDCLSVKSFSFGETVFSAGEEGDALYIIASGRVRVVGNDASGREVTLGVLSRGDFFGEVALFSDIPRTATVRAADDLFLLALDRKDFKGVVVQHPELGQFLERYIADLGVQNFLKQFTVLGLIPAPVLRNLVVRMRALDVTAGTVVIRQGETGDTFYIVREGTLDVIKKDENEVRVVGQIGPGEYFGEIALLKGTTRAATIKAKTFCRIHSLSQQDFESIVCAYPELRRRLEKMMLSYQPKESIPEELPRQPSQPGPAGKQEEAPLNRFDRDWRKLVGKRAESQPDGKKRRRFFNRHPFVEQHDETDCGAACLAMIARYYGAEVAVSRLRDLANVDRDGASMWSVAQAAEALGLKATGIQTSCEGLRDICKPSIVHWDGFHFIVLYEITGKRVVVGDPALGIRRLSLEQFRKGFTGRAIEITPTTQLKLLTAKCSAWDRFRKMLRPHLALIGWIFLASVLLNIFALGLPLFTQLILDRVLKFSSINLLNLLGASMVAVAVFQALVAALRRLLLIRFSIRTDLSLIGDFLRHVMRLPMKFFDLRRVGDVISRVSENEKIRNAMAGMLPGMALDACLALGYLGFLAWYSVKFTLVVLCAVPFFIALMLIFTPALRRNQREYFAKYADQWSYLIETISGIGTVKSMAVENAIRNKWERMFNESLVIGAHGSRIETAYSSLALFLSATASALFLWFGAGQALQGALTAGQLVALTAIAGNIIDPILRLVEAWQEFQDVRNAVERINDVFEAEPEERQSKVHSLLKLPRIQGAIRFDRVTFRYTPSQDKPILANLSFEIKPGETVAIVGRSGCGKSTLAKLVLGLYLSTEGQVFVDGHDMRIINRFALRAKTGVVPQEVFLFSGTIRENVAFGQDNVTQDRIVAACRAAAADHFIADLGLGYDTKVGERGMSLSGGQRQRIALARALLREPDLLILDEATSALDTDSERIIQKNLENMMKGKTKIVIAHRLSTVQNADRIIVLDKGILVEEGSHADLVTRGGLYAHLVGQQLSL